jgi:enoyl-CoA hydratase
VSDITVASDRATFRVPEALRGVADTWVGSRLPLYVGMERAKYIMLTCRPFDAAQALEWGFVSAVVPYNDLMDYVEALLDDVLLTGPAAREAYKAAANRLLPNGALDHPDYLEADQVYRSGEAREGLNAFKEKRAPRWVPAGHVARDARVR